MKLGDLLKIFLILLGILFFGGLLLINITSAIWSFLEDYGIELNLEGKTAVTLAIIVVIAAVAYLLVKEPVDKSERKKKK